MSRRVTSFVETTLVGLSIVALCVYLYVALSRIAYPFTIEWVESNTFLHVLRALQHKPIYTPPSYDFVPMIYTPFYYYVVAVFAKISGILYHPDQIMFSMRLVSGMASLLVFIMIYAICRIRRVSPLASLVAVGLCAASYPVTGYWFDVGRVDTLFLALVLVAYFLTIFRARRDSLVGALAGMIAFLSYATKQQAVVAVPFLLLLLVVEKRWLKAVWSGASFVLLWAIFVFRMNMATNGWFWIYTNQIPAAHPISWDMVGRDFWNLYIFPSYPWLIMVIVLAVISLWIMRDKVSVAQAMVHHSIFALTFFLPLSLMSIVSMAKQWGYINGLLPMVAALSVIGMEAYQRVVIALTSSQNKTWIFTALYALASVCLLFQFIALRYDFRTQIPSKASLEQGYRILSILKDSKQPVFIPTSPYLLYMVDQPTHFQVSSLSDLSLAGQYDPAIKELSKGYQEKISEYLMSKSIQTILLPNTNWYDKTFSVENGYDCESLVSDHSPLVTVTGAKSYLDRICRLRIASTQAQNR